MQTLARTLWGVGRYAGAILAVGLTPGLGVMCGCSNAVPRSMIVRVRAVRNGAPVPGAIVRLQPVHFFVPTELPLMGQHAILDPSPPAGSVGTTGSEGTVVLTGHEDHPIEVTVLATGYIPLEFELEAFPRLPTPWFRPWYTDVSPQWWLEVQCAPAMTLVNGNQPETAAPSREPTGSGLWSRESVSGRHTTGH